jgi:PAS domain S-box-containing protein
VLIDTSPGAVAFLRAGRVVLANARAADVFAASAPGELVGREILDLVHPDERRRFTEEAQLASSQPRIPPWGLWRLRRLDGSDFTAEVTVATVPDASGGDVQVVFREVSATGLLHGELQRANRALRFLTACNQALVRATSEEELLREICRCAVVAGGFRLAVAGYGDASDGSLRPVAWHGASEAHLERLRRVWAEGGQGTALASAAFRERLPFVSRDPQRDPGAAWRDDAIREGFTGVALLPLARGDAASGVLLIVSSEPDDFDEAVVALLRQLAEDVGTASPRCGRAPCCATRSSTPRGRSTWCAATRASRSSTGPGRSRSAVRAPRWSAGGATRSSRATSRRGSSR